MFSISFHVNIKMSFDDHRGVNSFTLVVMFSAFASTLIENSAEKTWQTLAAHLLRRTCFGISYTASRKACMCLLWERKKRNENTRKRDSHAYLLNMRLYQNQILKILAKSFDGISITHSVEDVSRQWKIEKLFLSLVSFTSLMIIVSENRQKWTFEKVWMKRLCSLTNKAITKPDFFFVEIIKKNCHCVVFNDSISTSVSSINAIVV